MFTFPLSVLKVTEILEKRDGERSVLDRQLPFALSNDDSMVEQKYETTSLPYCSRCKKAGNAIKSYMDSNSYDFGKTWLEAAGEFRNSECQVCQLIYRHCTNSEGALPDTAILSLYQYNHDSIFSIGSEGGGKSPFLLTSLTTSSPLHGHGVKVHPNLVDIERISRWLEICNEHHVRACHSVRRPGWLAPHYPITLIDTKLGCLTTGPVKRYLALSYVWGNSFQTLQTLTSNFGDFHEKGGLWKHLASIPKTILDAIRITESLIERYLWVDRLCIIQDCNESKSQQIPQMDSIFAGAYLTLVDQDGLDAEHGLPGVCRASCPRRSVQRLIRLLPDQLLSTFSPIWPYRSSWFSRAWTYQEMLLSRRMLLFAESGLTWNCQLMSSTEYTQGFEEMINGDTPHHKPLGLYINRWLSFAGYSSLVGAYNVRHLTFIEDRMKAFSGALSLMRQAYGELHFGVPEMFFDLGLSWQPLSILSRRILPQQEIMFPSWSWVGWHGLVDLSDTQDHYIYPDTMVPADGPVCQARCSFIYPLCKWYKLQSRSKERAVIEVTYRKYRSHCRKSDFSPPEGWSKELQKPDDENTVVWRHPHLRHYRFSYPIPINEARPIPSDGNLGSWSPYLYTKTNRTYLNVGTLKQRNNGSLVVQLVDTKRRVVGHLTLHENPKDTPTKDGFSPRQCELIALTKGKIWTTLENHLDPVRIEEELGLFHDKTRPDTFIYYNVMWIEWHDAVASRKGVGRVAHEAWNEQELEEIEVILG